MVIKSPNSPNGGGGSRMVSSSSPVAEEESCYVDKPTNNGRNYRTTSLQKITISATELRKSKAFATNCSNSNNNNTKRDSGQKKVTNNKNSKPKAKSTSGGTTKKVSFDTVSVYKVLHRSDYTASEKANTWFTGQEFLDIRNAALSFAKSMDSLVGIQKTKAVQNEGRGLERVMKHNLKKHSTRRKRLFAEIALLRRHGFHRVTPEDLALLFQSYTHVSALEARAMGRDDEVRARDCYSDDDEFMKLFFQLFGGNALLCSSNSAVGVMETTPSAPLPVQTKEAQYRKRCGRNRSNSKNTGSSATSNGAAVPLGSKSVEGKRKFRDEISSRLVAARSIR
ncbi:hypothetical protein IV203_014097 [Nitzschia inconspicua]|uniref:Uncharacterized protein n=1 Tax=Nitzschia inconspicua TaxID=303405 RepID=A0A9K3K6M7_9STRA|nr:hypothetical protein IV203_014285 [Nitzschia inconspicua]KAG7375002.1 hypothetical protein IV203_014097 [Nitzschia inconspicua]